MLERWAVAPTTNSTSNANGASDVAWDFKTSIHGMSVSYDSSNTLKKSLELNVKQVEGLKATWDCSFNAASGLNLGEANFNFSNDKLNANLGATVDANPDFKFDAAFDTKFEGITAGISTSFSKGALGDVAFGMHQEKGNVQGHWVADNIMNPSAGVGGIFHKLPNNKDFCCYGVIANTVSGTMSLAAADTCCAKNTMRYRIDHDGMFHVAKAQKLNQSMTLNLSAKMNLKDMSAGGHSFGAGLSWE